MKWLLIPGWGLGSESLEPLALALGGDVCCAPSPGSADWADYRAELVRRGRGRIWIGHSLGGMAAVRAGAAARAVVTLCANASFIARPHWPQALEPAALSQFAQDFETDAARAWPRFVALGARGDSRARAAARALTGPAPGWQRGLQWLAEFDNCAALAALPVPSLHILAGDDALVPATAAAGFARWPSARVEQIAGASHWLPITHAEPLAACIRAFAERLPAAPAEVARDFGRASGSYDQVAQVQQQAARRLAQLAEGISGPRLDVGAGTGLLSRMGAGPIAVAVDLAPAMLAEARARGAEGAPVAAGAAALPFAAGSFGCVLSNFMLQWCPQLEPVLAELARVLAPAGTLLVSAPGPGSLAQLRAAGLPEATCWVAPERLRAAAQGVGLEVELLETQWVTDWQPDARALLAAFKQLGAQRKRAGGGLGGRRELLRLMDSLDALRTPAGLAAHYEVTTLKARRA